MRDLPGWSTRWRPRHLAATSGWTLCRTLLCIRFLYDTTYSKMPDLWNQRGRNPWYEVDAKSLGSGLLEGNAQQTFGLDHTLFSITSDRKCYAMQATMLPVGKPLCQEFEITQFRDLSGKDWMECNLLWTSSIASNTLRFHSVWISRWCLQCRGTLAPTNRILGWRPLAVENSSAMSKAPSMWAMPRDWWANVPNVKSFLPVLILSDVTITWSKGLFGNSAKLNTPLRYSRQYRLQ